MKKLFGLGLLILSLGVYASDNVQEINNQCQSGDKVSCFKLGKMYYNGDSVPQDKSKASQLYTKACEAAYAKACHNLGVMYANGEVVPQDKSKVFDLCG